MTKAVLRVVQAGPLCSVQDGGRAGYLRFGVPASGAMDRAALALANHAAGNAPAAPAIEVSLAGLTVEVEQGPLTIALAGGGFLAEVGTARHGSWQRLTLQTGDRLTLRRGPWGMWCALAFAGRLVAREWLGSAATHALSGFGGGAIVAGQRFTVENPRLLPDAAIPCPVWARPRAEVAVVIGPQDRFFGADRLDLLLGATFRLTDAYDRMGVRLRGPSLAPQSALGIPSEPVLRGAIQVAGDGVPAVLLADHQTTGGYPKIATIIASELDAFAQIRPHAPVAFRAVLPDQAVALSRLRASAMARLLER